MKQRDFTSAEAKEALLPDKEEKYCGECCWFYAEDTDGYGLCPLALMESKRCDEPCTISEIFVSKEEMRHHMAVLLQDKRFRSNKGEIALYLPVRKADLDKAKEFSYKYMKVFSKL